LDVKSTGSPTSGVLWVAVTVAVGRRLPGTITAVESAVLPRLSVTRRLTRIADRLTANLRTTESPGVSKVPSPSRSQA
jgi:hypothetical protein